MFFDSIITCNYNGIIPFPFERTDPKDISNFTNGSAKNCVVVSDGGSWLKLKSYKHYDTYKQISLLITLQ